jgi:hypothetical protein
MSCRLAGVVFGLCCVFASREFTSLAPSLARRDGVVRYEIEGVAGCMYTCYLL